MQLLEDMGQQKSSKCLFKLYQLACIFNRLLMFLLYKFHQDMYMYQSLLVLNYQYNLSKCFYQYLNKSNKVTNIQDVLQTLKDLMLILMVKFITHQLMASNLIQPSQMFFTYKNLENITNNDMYRLIKQILYIHQKLMEKFHEITNEHFERMKFQLSVLNLMLKLFKPNHQI